LAVGSQFIAARSFMLTWTAQQDFFWQLSWRAPAIKPNTILITEDLPFSEYYSGTSLTAPLNLIYAKEHNAHQIPYLFLMVSQQASAVPSFEADLPMEYDFRSFEFNGNLSNMLVFQKTADGCLRILNPSDTSLEFINSKRFSFWQGAIPLSNLDRIVPVPETAALPQSGYFGAENRNQWCYYYEKADLARQQGKWQTTIQLYEEAQSAGFKPKVDAEWMPLLDAYLKTNQIDLAVETTKKITDHEPANTANYCQVWTDAKADKNVLPFAEEILSWLNCRE
jgi:hypothetical protein